MKTKKTDRPSNELLDKYIAKFNQDKRYKTADDAIIKLFKAFPKNDKLEDVLLKTSVLNDMYSTNIFGTFKVAEHILKLNIDRELEIGDPLVVSRIALGHGIKTKKNTEINFYSFATKYCSWHNQKEYPIYDSFVEKALLAFKQEDEFSEFEADDLRDFRKFRKIIGDFSSHYNLTKHNLKKIDKFLWIFGKEEFPPNYEKKKIQ